MTLLGKIRELTKVKQLRNSSANKEGEQMVANLEVNYYRTRCPPQSESTTAALIGRPASTSMGKVKQALHPFAMLQEGQSFKCWCVLDSSMGFNSTSSINSFAPNHNGLLVFPSYH